MRTLRRSIRRNAPAVTKRLSKSGVKPDPVIVYGLAKYFKALNRLAEA